MGGGLRYFCGAIAFGFAAMWIMATLTAALVCLAAAVAGYGPIVVAEWTRTKQAARGSAPGIAISAKVAQPIREPDLEEFPLTPDALNSDLGYVYEPAGATAVLTRENGWADDEGTAWSEMLH